MGGNLPDEALAWIFERAAGHPLFTVEYLRFLARQGLLWNDARRWRWRTPERHIIPVSVEALIEQVIAAAAGSPPHRAVLQAKAMLEPGVEAARLAVVAGLTLDELQAASAHLTRSGVLVDGEFAHPL
ncbi:hypothetical protein [Deinococcus sonorensis]|uniref:Uncharacterized protein n=2 Tax=Deinococcus sonorensis TaxID=309891 RepID=A0AAU7U6E3_9DEIO